MTTDVSMRPRFVASTTRRDVLIHSSIEIGDEAATIDPGGVSEHLGDVVSRSEPVAPNRDEFTDGHAATGHHERLPAVESAHDLAAVVTQFALGDRATHPGTA